MTPNASTTRLSNINPPPLPSPQPQRSPTAPQLDVPQAASAALVFVSTLFCFFNFCAHCRHSTGGGGGGGGGGGARSARGQRPLVLLPRGDLSYSTEPKPASLPPELPLVLYTGSADGKVEAAGDCVLCLGEFEEEKELKVITGCGHLFHPPRVAGLAWLVPRVPVLATVWCWLKERQRGEQRFVCIHGVGERRGEEEGGAYGISEAFGVQ